MVQFSTQVHVIEADNSVRTLPVDNEGSYFDAVQYAYESDGSFRRTGTSCYASLADMNQPVT